ncbi:hypothetical protein Bca4012_032028 [Brassica carinata]
MGFFLGLHFPSQPNIVISTLKTSSSRLPRSSPWHSATLPVISVAAPMVQPRLTPSIVVIKHPLRPEAQELADTGSCPGILLLHENTVAELLQQRISSSEETDGSFSCHLDFTLSSAPLPASQMAKTIVQFDFVLNKFVRAYKVSVNGGMKFAVEEADMTA